MSAGGPNDHPISDILNYGLEVYGKETDENFKALAALLSKKELEDFWSAEIGWQSSKENAANSILQKLDWAKQRAKNSGWESQE